MGLFKNLSATKLQGDFVYPMYGNYYVRIDKVKIGETRKLVKNIIIDYTVVAVLQHGEPAPNHVVGDEACHYIEVSGNEYAAADWAGFITAALGCKPEDLDNPEIREALGNRDTDDWASNDNTAAGRVQPLRGLVMELNVKMVMTKEKPGQPSHPFTKVRWRRQVELLEVVKSMTPEQVTRFFPTTSA